MKKLSPRLVTRLAVEAQNILSALEDQKKLYERLDQITVLLKDQDLARHGIQIVDNFATKNTAFKVAFMRRFDLKRTKVLSTKRTGEFFKVRA